MCPCDIFSRAALRACTSLFFFWPVSSKFEFYSNTLLPLTKECENPTKGARGVIFKKRRRRLIFKKRRRRLIFAILNTFSTPGFFAI